MRCGPALRSLLLVMFSCTSSQGWCTARLRQGDSSVGGVLPATCVPCPRVKLRFMFANSVLLRIAVPESDRELVL